MKMEGIGSSTVINKYTYNYKELNEDFGLNWHDYGARWYDAALGRWWSVDPMAEPQANYSPYAYTYNNPLSFIDPTGMMGEGADGLTNEQWLDQSRKDGGYWASAKNELKKGFDPQEQTIEDFEGRKHRVGGKDFQRRTVTVVIGTRVEINGVVYHQEQEEYVYHTEGPGHPRPKFDELWNSYLDYVNYPDDKFAKIVGGKYNFNYSTNAAFANTCAVRVSFCLNKAGYYIRKHDRNPDRSYNTVSGDYGVIYYFKTLALKNYLTKTYGEADIVSKDISKFNGLKGIIFFDIREWNDAAGHFTLWNGSSIKGGNHDVNFYFSKATNVYLWKLD